jgi:hypothetical protein
MYLDMFKGAVRKKICMAFFNLSGSSDYLLQFTPQAVIAKTTLAGLRYLSISQGHWGWSIKMLIGDFCKRSVSSGVSLHNKKNLSENRKCQYLFSVV